MPLGRFQFVSFVQVDLRWHLEELCVQGDTDTHPFNCEGVTNFKMGIREVEGLQQRKKRVGARTLVLCSDKNQSSNHKDHT